MRRRVDGWCGMLLNPQFSFFIHYTLAVTNRRRSLLTRGEMGDTFLHSSFSSPRLTAHVPAVTFTMDLLTRARSSRPLPALSSSYLPHRLLESSTDSTKSTVSSMSPIDPLLSSAPYSESPRSIDSRL